MSDERCQTCGGAGYSDRYQSKCVTCRGRGTVYEPDDNDYYEEDQDDD